MEMLQTPTQTFHDVSVVQEKVLRSLQLHGPMPVEELVEKTPLFRWVEVLRAVSQLWGEGKLRLESHEGHLKIWPIEVYRE